MDAHWFDTVVKTVAQRTTRRWVLGGLGGLVLTARGTQVSVAQDPLKPDGKKCNKNEQCQSGLCCQESDQKHGTCAATATIQECGGRCSTADQAATITRPCGTVPCPSCDQCAAQTGCADSALLRDNAEQDPPAGESYYCAQRPNPQVAIACPCDPGTASFCASSGGSLGGQCVLVCAS